MPLLLQTLFSNYETSIVKGTRGLAFEEQFLADHLNSTEYSTQLQILEKQACYLKQKGKLWTNFFYILSAGIRTVSRFGNVKIRMQSVMCLKQVEWSFLKRSINSGMVLMLSNQYYIHLDVTGSNGLNLN